MKRLVRTVALALVVGTTQPGCPFTAAGALIGLIAGAVSDDPFPDTNDRLRHHAAKGAEIGLQIDVALLYCMLEGGCAGRGPVDDGTALALVDVPGKGAGTKEGPRTAVVVGPTSCTLACRF